MTSPGGRPVAQVSVRIVPNSSGFDEQLRRELADIKDITIDVGFDVHSAELRRELAGLDHALNIAAEVDLDRATFDAEVAALDARHATVTADVDLDTAAATARLDAFVAASSRKQIDIDVDVDAARASVATAVGRIGDTIASGLGTAFSAVGGRISKVGADISSVTPAVVGLVGQVVQLGATATAAAVAGAGITAAYGAAATAVAALPGAISLMAAPIATVMAGMDGIKKAASSIEPEFNRLKESVSRTFQQGLTPVFKELRDVFPTLQTGMNLVATSLVGVTGRLTEFITQGAQLDRIRGIFANVGKALTDMGPGIQNVLDGFLRVASQSGVFDALSGAVNTFGAEFQRSVIDRLNDGTLRAATDGLGAMLDNLARGLVGAVDNGIKVFAAAAPGVNQALEAMGGFLSRFNWTSLGQSVGSVFSGLGETLKGVDTSVIRDIETSFGRLGDLFKDPKFQGDIQTMFAGLPAAIDTLRGFASDFATIGAGISQGLQVWSAIDTNFRTFVDNFNQSASDFGKDLGFQGPGSVGEWLQGIDQSIDEFFGILPPKTEQLGTDTVDAYGSAIRSGRGGGGTFGDATKDALGEVAPAATAGLAPLAPAIASGLTPAQAALQTGVAALAPLLQAGFAALAPAVTTGMTGIATAVTTGMTQVSTVFNTGFLNMGTQVTVAFTALASQANSGMTLVSSAIAAGFPLITSVMNTGFLNMGTQVTVAFTALASQANSGMTLVSSAIAAGFPLITAAVTAGMQTVTTAFTTGWTAVAAAVTTSMAPMVTAVTTGMQLMVTAITTGTALMTTALAAFTAISTAGMTALAASMTAGAAAITASMLALAAAVNAGAVAINASLTSISTGMTAVVAAVVAGMAAATAAVTTGAAAMAAAIVQLGATMTATITAAMAQFTAVITNGANQAVAAMQSAVSRMLGVLSAAVGQFRAAGANMGQALADGLNSKVGAVQAAAARLAQAAAAATAAAAQIRSPSRVFIGLGEMLGAGLAVGMDDSQTRVEKAGERLVDTVTDTVEKVTGAFRADAWTADFNARVNSSLASLDVSASASADGQGGGITVNMTAINPQAEPTSTTTIRKLRNLKEAGLFG